MNNEENDLISTHVEQISTTNQTVLDGMEGVAIGSGKLTEKIGQGGMASVYKIWNKDLDTFRVIKVAQPGAGEHFYRRFISEARINEKLKHHNIIEIKNIDRWNGRPYIEMEYIDGYTLREILKEQGRLPVQVSYAIAVHIVRALKYAHSANITIEGNPYKGIFHRDLKPENIMIARTGRVIVMDFGLARPIAQSINSTGINTFVGTPRYAAPEQFEPGKKDHRVDLYTIGIILYEMLSGYHPFMKIEEQCRDTEEYITKRKNADWNTIGKPEKKIPVGLSKIIKKCLENNLNKRYKKASELLDDLMQCNFGSEILEEEFIASRIFKTDYSDNKGAKSVLSGDVPVRKTYSLSISTLIIGFLGITGSVVLLTTIPKLFLKRHSAKESDIKVLETVHLSSKRDMAGEKSMENFQSDTLLSEKKLLSTNDSVGFGRNGTNDIPLDTIAVASKPVRQRSEPNKKVTEDSPVPSLSQKSSVALAKNKSKNSSHNSLQTAAPEIIKQGRKSKREIVMKNTDDEDLPDALPEIDAIAQLKKKYGSNDLITAAYYALNKNALNDCIALLDALPEDHPKRNKKAILLLGCYNKKKDILNAKNLVDKVTLVNAADYDYQKGKYYLLIGNYTKAIRFFDSALETPPLIMNRQQVIGDALYFCAFAHQKRFDEEKNTEYRNATLTAWSNVKRHYSNNPKHPRFKEAKDKMSH